ncbi:hypothetical protein DPX16_21179 [Anabarilius grahami]|uniref:Uncharacterized protein n=1 Tax=Anabarilius grahami TaxID=495550 RepID=A0A3N0Z3D1_ANAGA|nr:hypothetical protein DPX16_21179 [Anabarilius grahami]
MNPDQPGPIKESAETLQTCWAHSSTITSSDPSPSPVHVASSMVTPAFRNIVGSSEWNEQALLTTYRHGSIQRCVFNSLSMWIIYVGLEKFIQHSIYVAQRMQNCLEENPTLQSSLQHRQPEGTHCRTKTHAVKLMMHRVGCLDEEAFTSLVLEESTTGVHPRVPLAHETSACAFVDNP